MKLTLRLQPEWRCLVPWLRTKQMPIAEWPEFRSRFESLFADFNDDPGLALQVSAMSSCPMGRLSGKAALGPKSDHWAGSAPIADI
jgi:hypothetical protein